MKKTVEDERFAEAFGRALAIKYSAAKRREPAITDQEFATSIGVVRGQLEKYLAGVPVPSVRTIWLALKNHGISVSYEGLNVARSMKRKKAVSKDEDMQLVLPFTVSANASNKFDCEVKKLGPRKFALEVRIKKIG